MFRLRAHVLAACLLFAAPALAADPCDPSGADAASLSDLRASIETECPCEAAASRSEYRRCAKPVVSAAVESESLRSTCRREALRFAKLSRCGIEGAVVCCRLDTLRENRERHRVVASEDCVAGDRYTACESPQTSIVTGCDATGCAVVCGDGVVTGSEECEPPGVDHCDANCFDIPYCGDGDLDPDEECEPRGTDTCSLQCEIRNCLLVPEDCGNLVVDPGETCDPPGVGSCSNLCQAAPCTAPALGEIDVACAEGTSEIAAASTSDRHLLVWTGTHRRPNELLARRYLGNGTPADDTLSIVSDELTCDHAAGFPSAASNGTDFVVLWASGVLGGVPAQTSRISWRDVGGTAGVGSTKNDFPTAGPIGSCGGVWWQGPTTASGAPGTPFALGWGELVSRCAYWRDIHGVLYQPAGDPERTNVHLSFPITVYEGFGSYSSTAALNGSTLWVARAIAGDGMSFVSYLSGAWSDGLSTGAKFSLGLTGAGAVRRPSVAAGDASFLVAWSAGTPAVNQIRAIRVTRAAGRIDPAGGLLLAGTAGAVTGGPSVAFDGSRWLVAWTEAAVTANDLKAVAIEADGSVVDATPRTLATQVAAQDPAMTSTGDGNVLVAFRRDESGWSAIRAVSVQP